MTEYALTTTGRLVRRRVNSGAVLALDTSISMDMQDGWDSGDYRRRIDVLGSILVDILMSGVRLQSVITFGSEVTEIPLSGSIVIPEPDGTTAMHKAMQWALAQDTTPKRLVLVSDGAPDDADACRVLAAQCREKGIVIDAYYCGPAGDSLCMRLMSDLAAAGAPGGQSGAFKLTGPDSGKAAETIILRITHQS